MRSRLTQTPTEICGSIAAVLFAATNALASQGPGILPGTASPITQTVMAVLVYGLSAAIVAFGLIGAVRKR